MSKNAGRKNKENKESLHGASTKKSETKPCLTKHKKLGKAGKITLKVCAFFFTFLFMIVLTLYISLGILCRGNSEIKYITVPTFLETGAFKFVPSLYLSKDEIQAIVDSNKMADMEAEPDEDMITVGNRKNGILDIAMDSKDDTSDGDTSNDEPIIIEKVSGSTYSGTMMIVKDPSRISLATIYPWREYGVTLEQLVKDAGAVGGINGGLYSSNGNTGGAPRGVVVSHGEIQLNQAGQWTGLVLIGFSEDDILRIIDISDMNKQQVEKLVKDRKIRDAVTFQDEARDTNNHFVKLIINGESRDMNGKGSGLNPRTAIGQREDGSVLMFVTDGRGKSGHLGASASDLIEVMERYGAVNAANLDGGSSSCMYYGDKYLMTSVTFYYSNSSWRLPAGFVIK